MSELITYAMRVRATMNTMRAFGINPSDILRQLRINAEDDRWDDTPGEALFEQCQIRIPTDTHTREEFFYILGMGSGIEQEECGDITRAKWLETGEYAKRVYGTGRYNQRYEHFLYELYCTCATDTRMSNKNGNTNVSCDVCLRRDYIRAFALRTLGIKDLTI